MVIVSVYNNTLSCKHSSHSSRTAQKYNAITQFDLLICSSMSNTLSTTPRPRSTSSNSSVQCIINKQSYTKLISHIFKYQANTLCGAVLGTYNTTTNQPAISDIIPLYHTISMNLSSVNELIFDMIELYCTNNQLQLIGVYIVPHTIDITPQQATLLIPHITNKLYELNNKLLILSIDQNELNESMTGSNDITTNGALYLYQRDTNDKKWVESEIVVSVDSATMTYTHQLLLNDNYHSTGHPKYIQLIDMDDHFNDPAKDWTNSNYVDT